MVFLSTLYLGKCFFYQTNVYQMGLKHQVETLGEVIALSSTHFWGNTLDVDMLNESLNVSLMGNVRELG